MQNRKGKCCLNGPTAWDCRRSLLQGFPSMRAPKSLLCLQVRYGLNVSVLLIAFIGRDSSLEKCFMYYRIV